MRLLNTSDLTFREFTDGRDINYPGYAILSHRWFAAEPTYQDMCSSRIGDGLTPGYDKVQKLCNLAQRYGHRRWAWVDTVCIDKTSSAELQESINSMWSWYQNAGVCFVYLSDVPGITKTDIVWNAWRGATEMSSAAFEIFRRSEWFHRGWTLQELLAPSRVLFFNADWQEIGEKSTFAHQLQRATNINQNYLRNPSDIYKTPVATRMSWAANRRTTRIEDKACALLGLFNVAMLLLYGEGNKAFLRLQMEIIQQSDDESIFAWSTEAVSIVRPWGLLAPWPDAFEHSGNVVCSRRREGRDTFKMTNNGLKVRMPIIYWRTQSRSSVFASFPAGRSDSQATEMPSELPRQASIGDRLCLALDAQLVQGSGGKESPISISLMYGESGWQRIGLEALGTITEPIMESVGHVSRTLYIQQPGLHRHWPKAYIDGV